MASIVFSAQFGGRDAAAFAMQHFRALKGAATKLGLLDFPFPELAFVLRVDGEITKYGFSGISNPEVDSGRRYLSLDIGITLQDRPHLVHTITKSISDSGPIISDTLKEYGLTSFDGDSLDNALKLLCQTYKIAVQN